MRISVKSIPGKTLYSFDEIVSPMLRLGYDHTVPRYGFYKWTVSEKCSTYLIVVPHHVFVVENGSMEPYSETQHRGIVRTESNWRFVSRDIEIVPVDMENSR
jgi:hypothetical protein